MEEIKKDSNITTNNVEPINVIGNIDNENKANDKNIISLNDENNEDFFTFDGRTPKNIEWLWRPYLVKGNLNIVVGDGGVGKSYLITWLVSAISKGAKIPFSDNSFKVGKSILQNIEDDSDSAILPRLILNDADLSKVGAFNEEKKFLAIQQIKRLEERIKNFMPDVVVLDPIQSYVGDININSQNEVKSALKPLKRLAKRYNCAIVMIMHLNKNNNSKAYQRVNGSTEFITSSRSAILIAENPENNSERLFIPLKTNLMKENEKNTLSFKINDYGKVEWLENKGYMSADNVISATNNYNHQSMARGFIIGALSRGEIKGIELKELALKNNITEKNYNITKANLNNEEIINNFHKGKISYWKLKDKEEN